MFGLNVSPSPGERKKLRKAGRSWMYPGFAALLGNRAKHPEADLAYNLPIAGLCLKRAAHAPTTRLAGRIRFDGALE